MLFAPFRPLYQSRPVSFPSLPGATLLYQAPRLICQAQPNGTPRSCSSSLRLCSFESWIFSLEPDLGPPGCPQNHPSLGDSVSLTHFTGLFNYRHRAELLGPKTGLTMRSHQQQSPPLASPPPGPFPPHLRSLRLRRAGLPLARLRAASFCRVCVCDPEQRRNGCVGGGGQARPGSGSVAAVGPGERLAG